MKLNWNTVAEIVIAGLVVMLLADLVLPKITAAIGNFTGENEDFENAE